MDVFETIYLRKVAGFSLGFLTSRIYVSSGRSGLASILTRENNGLFVTLVPKDLLLPFLIRWLKNFGDLSEFGLIVLTTNFNTTEGVNLFIIIGNVY